MFSKSDVTASSLVRDQYGEEVVLFNDQEESNVYRLLSEFKLQDQVYAVLQLDTPKGDEEYEIFRVYSSGSELEMESIEDEEEWENVAEIYDEMVFGDEED